VGNPAGLSVAKGAGGTNRTNSLGLRLCGAAGIGPWEDMEMRGFLSQFAYRGCAVIPVLLKKAPSQPPLPLFLKQFHFVDFRNSKPDPFALLIWGITGRKPSKLPNGAK
jgi:hypothetical protein